MPAPAPPLPDRGLAPAPLPGGVGVYDRPRSAWLRQHLALVLGVVLSLVSVAIYAIRRWA